MPLQLELESNSMSLESELELESHDAGIGIRIGIKIVGQHWNRSWNQNYGFLENSGIRIRIGINPSGIGVTGTGIIYNSGMYV